MPGPIERSTYVLVSSVLMIVLFWQWRPMGGVIWQVDEPVARTAITAAYFAGWGVILVSTCLLNPFELFGLRQVWLSFRGEPYTHLPFRVPVLYRFVRHPLYVGWLMTFWAAPDMSVARLLFAVTTTVYILVAIKLEERNLVEHLREYEEYRRRVPMLIPFTKGPGRGLPAAEPASAAPAADSAEAVRRPV